MQGHLDGKDPCLHQKLEFGQLLRFRVCGFDIYLGHGFV